MDKQTIDGVSRELIERITNPFGDPHDKFNAVQELRALLDNPEKFECLDGGKCGIGGYCDACPHTKPAAQPQGEVERLLKGQIKALEACGDLSEKQRDHWMEECRKRDAQLAERDALLKRCESFIKFVHKCVRRNGEYAPLHRQEMDELNRDLSDYGESSFSVCEQCRGEGRVGGPAPDEGGGKNCPACRGTGVIERQLSTSAEPKPRGDVDGNSHAPKQQGEPAAWAYKVRVHASGIGMVWRDKIEREAPDTDAVEAKDLTPLYAEQPAPVAVVLPERDALRDLIAEAVGGDTYDCVRVWSAWGVGTMSVDDFVPVVEQDDRLYEIADSVIDAVAKLNGLKP